MFYNHTMSLPEVSYRPNGQEYQWSMARVAAVGATLPIAEPLLQNTPAIHDAISGPLNPTNYIGNMYVGATIAAGVSLAYATAKGIDRSLKDTAISQASMETFRRRGVAVACGATAVVNCLTETKWGVQHFPLAEWIHGETPDIFDTLASTATAAVASLAFWRKKKGCPPSEEDLAKLASKHY
jgi:hypothetical protein